jgi:hypothetical protein
VAKIARNVAAKNHCGSNHADGGQAIRRDGSRHSGAKPLENPSFALGKPILLYAA